MKIVNTIYYILTGILLLIVSIPMATQDLKTLWFSIPLILVSPALLFLNNYLNRRKYKNLEKENEANNSIYINKTEEYIDNLNNLKAQANACVSEAEKHFNDKAMQLQEQIASLEKDNDDLKKYIQENTMALEDRKRERELLDSFLEVSSKAVDTMDGIAYERYVAIKLTLAGWKNLQFTKASGDYGADLIGVDYFGENAVVQCKHYEGTVGIDAVQEVFSAKTYFNCENAYVACPNGYTTAAQNLAYKLNVRLLIEK